jgi:hypothetical protein
MIAAGGFVGSFAEQCVQEGALTAEEARQLVEDISTAALRGEAFVAVTMFAVVGRKPA